MDLYEAIEKRFSVRSYENRPIEEDKLQRILEVGRIAPSASNRQDWKFVVVRDATLRAGLAKATEQPFVGTAPVILAVVADDLAKTMLCGVSAGTVDCAIAIDHMTLAAVAEGLGTCWIGHFNQAPCRKLLGVPESATIIELVTIGYPAASPKAKVRKTMEEIVSYDKFE